MPRGHADGGIDEHPKAFTDYTRSSDDACADRRAAAGGVIGVVICAVPWSVTGLPEESSSNGVPTRTCVGCRARGPQDRLLRVVAVTGVLTPDPTRRLPGRGAYLHPRVECLALAERKRVFARALRLSGPAELSQVRAHLEQLRVEQLNVGQLRQPVVQIHQS